MSAPVETYRGVEINRTADVQGFHVLAKHKFCFISRHRPEDDAPVLSVCASVEECRAEIDELAAEAGYAKSPKRTPEQIIGHDALMQLIFEGYQVVATA